MKNFLKRTLRVFTICALLSALAFSTNNVELKADDTIPMSVEPCVDATLNGLCNSWTPWEDEILHTDFDSKWYTIWHLGPRTFKCPVKINYRWRACLTDPYLRQYDIVGFTLDLSYKIWVIWHGWIYPCREGLEIFKGSEAAVSQNLTSLYDSLLLTILKNHYNYFFKYLDQIEPNDTTYIPCNSNTPSSVVISSKATCQAKCVVSNMKFTGYSYPEEYIDFLRDFYSEPIASGEEGENENPIEPIIVEALLPHEVDELNDYIQTEINPFIYENDFKLPVFAAGPDITIKYIPCADNGISDFCCIDKYTICRDYKNNRTLKITHSIETGTIPSGCLEGYTPPVTVCPIGELPSVIYRCTETCTGSSGPQTDPIIVTEEPIEITDITGVDIAPNPTNNGTILTFTVLTPGNLVVKLFNETGEELMELHNAYTKRGEFSKNFTMSKFSKGVYFMRIEHNGKIKMEKFIRN